METKFNFKSQVCTSIEQSRRLLELGLKKETADMFYSYDIICAKPYYKVVEFMNGCVPEDIFPAWSLHRLWELNRIRDIILDSEEEIAKLYDEIINNIEAQIKAGNFNKEYLV